MSNARSGFMGATIVWEVPNSKFQVPSSKFQVPSSKQKLQASKGQASKKIQTTSSNWSQALPRRLGFKAFVQTRNEFRAPGRLGLCFCGGCYILAGVAVQNRIVKVQKRNRALVRFDEARIGRAVFRAAESIGGFHQDFQGGINDKIFEMC